MYDHYHHDANYHEDCEGCQEDRLTAIRVTDEIAKSEAKILGSSPSFTKKHYEFIANLFWQAYNDPEVISIAQLDKLLVEFIHAFEQDNSNFDRRKFERAARSFQ